jgi:hypothetical protein
MGLTKDKLEKDAWYKGNSDSTNIAQWTGIKFRFIKDKLSGCYIDVLNHYEDGGNIFIPIEKIEL